MLKKVDYDKAQHAVYAKGRALGPEVIARWMAAFAAQLPERRPLTIIDLGSGTGRFTPALADAFGGPVFGVEPSERMRAVAMEEATHPDVVYLPGEASRIPLPDASADAVLMFLSFHHVPDREAAAREIARVLKPSGRLLMRSTFADRIHQAWWYGFFPRMMEIELALFPTVKAVSDLFAGAGLGEAQLVEVELPPEDDLVAVADRLRLRAISLFEHLEEEEIAEGFARMDAAIAAGEIPRPGPLPADLLVLSASEIRPS
jgi:ubiquinone/menaquinone biosynthesis C-methylase UbiE